MDDGVLIIGSDISNIQTALDFADCGIKVTIVEESASLQANNGQNGGGEWLRLMPTLLKAANHPNIKIITYASIFRVEGKKGNFRVKVTQHPRFVDTATCVSCARCEQECPVRVIPPGKISKGHKAIHRPDRGLKSVPPAFIVEKKGISPCSAACPAGINVQAYVALISQGKFNEALNVITEAVAFPRVLGRVCHHPCEQACSRGKIDQPIAICSLKRFVSNGSSPIKDSKPEPPPGKPRVAIIGSGPAGLTAARDLARIGHRSTVFEALPVPGGMVAVGMPRFRLPREVRQSDINDILNTGGIEIRTSTPIGPDLTLDDLHQQGYEAILLAIGAHKNLSPGIEGEGLEGVINSVALLEALNLRQPFSVGKRVVVVGGGYTGIDSARTAVRLHCERVLVVDKSALEDLTVNPDEVAEAKEEGVEFKYLVAPIRIVGKDGKVAGVELQWMKQGKLIKNGCHETIPIPESEFFVEADTIIMAIGQRPDLSFLNGDNTLTNGGRHIAVDRVTMASNIPGIFAAGDAANECGPMVNAIAEAHRAAISIDCYIRSEDIKKADFPQKKTPVEVNPKEVYVPLIERQIMPCLPLKERLGNFEEVERGFTAKMAIKEASRCLNCGVCSGCLECERACELKAIDHDTGAKEIELEVSNILLNEKSSTVPEGEGIYEIIGESSIARLKAELARHSGIRLNKSNLEIDILQPENLSKADKKAGIFICTCGDTISSAIDIPAIIDYYRKLKNTSFVHRISYACNADTAKEIQKLIKENSLTHAIIAACSCCNLDQICFSCSDRRVKCKAHFIRGLSDKTYYEFVNIREHCAWVHHENNQAATEKAKRLIKAGLFHALESQPLARKEIEINRRVIIVGSDLSSYRAAVDLSSYGVELMLVDSGYKEDLQHEYRLTAEKLQSELSGNGNRIIDSARLLSIDGIEGRLDVSVARNGLVSHFDAGAVIIDSKNKIGCNGNKLPGVFFCGPDKSAMPISEELKEGTSVANKVLAFLNARKTETIETFARVNAGRCRGCGTCESLCESGAIKLVEKTQGFFQAQVDEWLCRGCGVCVARCPSGALSQNGYDDSQITASLRAILD